MSDYFPILIDEKFLSPLLYREIEEKFDAFFEASNERSSFGQLHRSNVVITASTFKNNKSPLHKLLNSEKFYCFKELFEYLNGKQFRNKYLASFSSKAPKYGLLGNFASLLESAELELSVCIAQTGYENPFHVDTRKRLIHGLSYFSPDDFSGGEFSVAKSRARPLEKFPQILHHSEILDKRSFSPKKNQVISVLSTPNSYHAGQKSEGTRRFLYFAYNFKDSKSYWPRSISHTFPMNFEQGKKYQNMPLWLAKLYLFLITRFKLLVSVIRPI